jgi:hypothetical protein
LEEKTTLAALAALVDTSTASSWIRVAQDNAILSSVSAENLFTDFGAPGAFRVDALTI